MKLARRCTDLIRFYSILAELEAAIGAARTECSGRMVWPGSAEDFSRVQASPSLDGDKVMRLRAQTAKIEGGFVIFPEEAPWLDTYLRELLSFPNSKNDDQVDSTVYALAWITEHPEPGILGYYRNQANAQLQRSNQNKNTRVLIPPGPSHWEINGRSMLMVPPNRECLTTPVYAFSTRAVQITKAVPSKVHPAG
jgi:hypothetical protein